MIKARFDISRPPDGSVGVDPPPVTVWVDAWLYLPDFDSWKWVSFVVDTGSQATCLDLNDAWGLFPARSLVRGRNMGPIQEVQIGCGLFGQCYVQRAYVQLEHEDGRKDALEIMLHVPVPNEQNFESMVGSLLGMDILSRYSVDVTFATRSATLEYPDGRNLGNPVTMQDLHCQVEERARLNADLSGRTR